MSNLSTAVVFHGLNWQLDVLVDFIQFAGGSQRRCHCHGGEKTPVVFTGNLPILGQSKKKHAYLGGGWTNPFRKICESQIGSFPQGSEIKNVWNHHPVIIRRVSFSTSDYLCPQWATNEANPLWRSNDKSLPEILSIRQNGSTPVFACQFFVPPKKGCLKTSP